MSQYTKNKYVPKVDDKLHALTRGGLWGKRGELNNKRFKCHKDEKSTFLDNDEIGRATTMWKKISEKMCLTLIS